MGEQFVLVARKLRAPFVRAVREAGSLVIEFRALYDKPFQGAGPIETTELGEFAKALAREQGMRLGSGALAALLARTGNQLGSIDAGLQKLRSVCGDRDVSSADVVLHVAATRPGSPWILGESILAGDAKRAMNEWALIGRSGARDGDGKSIAPEGAFVMALAAAVRDARRNHEAARRIRCGMSLEQAAASVGVPFFPAAMETFARALRARSLAGHRRLLDDLLRIRSCRCGYIASPSRLRSNASSPAPG